MRKQIFLTLLVILTSLCAFAESPCATDSNDEYWPSVRLPKTIANGAVAGECMDTKLARGLRIIDKSKIAESNRRNNIEALYVANFRHLDQYWLAEIPIEGVQQVLIQAEVDPNGTAFHNETRFLMFKDQPVKLFPQTSGQTTPGGQQLLLTDFVFTGVNLRPISMIGPSFTIMRGLEGFFIQAFSLMSMHDTFFSETGPNKDFDQYRLKLDASQRKELLVYHIKASDSKKETELYNTATNNCITELFDGLYSVMRFHYAYEKQIFNILNGRVWLPTLVVPMLQNLQFIDSADSSRAPTYKEELKSGILPIPLEGGGAFYEEQGSGH